MQGGSQRTGALRDRLAPYVDRGDVPGIVALMCRGENVQVESIGCARDTIFRIASLTKPVVAVAAMALVEDGLMELDEPVDRLAPELADRRVLSGLDADLGETVPAERSITVRDLLTMRMGFGFVLGPGSFPIMDAAAELGVAPGPPDPARSHPPDEWMRRLGSLPLMRQPGEAWMYDTATSVLGVVVARAAGGPLADVLAERVFHPLGMVDTGFFVPPPKVSRLAPMYGQSDDGGWTRPPAFPDAAGGLVSTVDDYFAFVRGARFTTDMTTNQLTDDQRSDAAALLGEQTGWGLGLSVSLDGNRYGWDGGTGTSWYSDRAQDLVGILMYQRMDPTPFDIRAEFWSAAPQP